MITTSKIPDILKDSGKCSFLDMRHRGRVADLFDENHGGKVTEETIKSVTNACPKDKILSNVCTPGKAETIRKVLLEAIK
jgi:hypothetical protein